MSGRWKSWLLLGSLLSLGSAAAGCGGGDAVVDQGRADSGADMGGGDGGSDGGSDAGITALLACERGDLFMSAIDLAAGTVTLTNPTAADINIEDGAYQFCQGPGAYSALPAGVVPAGGSLTVTVPVGNITLDTVDGTLALYNPGSFTTRNAMLDYVCWGDGSGTPRLNVAQQVGSDGTVLWDAGGCVQLAGATSLYLRTGTSGNTAGDYTNASVDFVCTPTNQDAGVDSGMSDLGVDAGPVVLLECDRTHLVIESVNTQTEEITLYNPTGATITTTGDYQLCQGPGNYAAVPALTFAPYARHTFSAPSAIDLGANQTVALYSSASFGTRDAMVDYMCWGSGGTRPRLTEARTVGSDGTVMWDDGGCPAAAANATVYRVPSTEGNSADHYTTTMPSMALDCDTAVD